MCFCVHNLFFCLCFGLCFVFGLFFGFFAWELGLGEALLYVAWECLGTAWAPKLPNRVNVFFMHHCSELGIERICASVRRPTTCGKIEAFHKAYEVESHLFTQHRSFIRYYNYTRPHEGINYLTPGGIYLN